MLGIGSYINSALREDRDRAQTNRRRAEEAEERAVDAEKQVYLTRAGRDYAHRAGVKWGNVRFDIVSIVLAKPLEIEWIRDAFGANQVQPARYPMAAPL